MHRHLVTLGQTPAFVASMMMMLLLMENKRAAVWTSSAGSSYNGGEAWKPY